MPWDKVKGNQIQVEKTPEQIVKENLVIDISVLEEKKKNIKNEVDLAIRQAFKVRDEELAKREQAIYKAEQDISARYSDAQFIINKNNDEFKKIKEEYELKSQDLIEKNKKIGELRDILSSITSTNEHIKKELVEKSARIDEIGLNIADNNRKLAEQLVYAQKGNDYIDSLKLSLENDRAILDSAILRNKQKEIDLENEQNDIDEQYSELECDKKSLEKTKLDFVNDSEKAGHEIKKQLSDIKVSHDAVKAKEVELNSKQQDIDDRTRFLALKERQIDEKIKILKELRNQGGANV
jgi:hypothetical protein